MPRALLRDIRGRNGVDDGFTMPDWQASECLNVEFTKPGKFAQRRRGSNDVGASATGNTLGFYGVESDVNDNKTAWQIYTDGVTYRGGVLITLTDEALSTTEVYDTSAVNFNGKYFLAYKPSSVNRLHVYDPLSGTVRRVGLALPAAATVANQGAGAYAATIRYYKVAWADINGTDTRRRSELSAAVSFTPSGAGASARVTRPTAASEGETHWLVYGSPDDVNYFLLSTIAIATTTYDDSTAPSAYTGALPQTAGTNIPPPAAKYIIADRGRLVMAGSWATSGATGETAPRNNRVFYTRVTGASDIGDDETIPNITASATDPGQKNWIDVGENDGSGISGLGGPLDGVIYVFKRRGIYQLIATDDDVTPYMVKEVTRSLGCLHHRSICLGEDSQGRPCLYFMDAGGPYRISASGIQYLGRDVEDLLLTASAPMQRNAATALVAAAWHAPKKQVWWAAKNTSGYSVGLTFSADVAMPSDTNDVRGGWARLTFPSATAIYASAAVFPAPGEADTSLNTCVILAGVEGSTAVIRRFDVAGTTQDSSTSYQAYVESKPLALAGLGRNMNLDPPYLHALAQTGTVRVTFSADFGRESHTGDVSLAAVGTETRVQKTVESLAAADLGVVQIRVGDSAAQNIASWEIDAIELPWTPAEPR